MKVLVTGHLGYIGAVLTPLLADAGHRVVGLDSDLYRGCTLGPGRAMYDVPWLQRDLRDVTAADLEGFDAVVHLAALSNDPLGDLDPACTYSINLHASVRLARLAAHAGVGRFLFSSSCSVYGAAGDGFLSEAAPFNPVTPYGESKVKVESALADLATATFAPTFLRNATAYGYSPRLRMDLVVNDMVGAAVTTGKIVVKSDGTPWRPLVHVQDIARAFVAALTAPRAVVSNQAFNVGQTSENYRVSEVAELVSAAVPGSAVEYAAGGGPDKRCYRVDFSRIAARLPGFVPLWNLERGIRQLATAFQRLGCSAEELGGDRYVRLRRIRALLADGSLDGDLRWTGAPVAPSAEDRVAVDV